MSERKSHRRQRRAGLSSSSASVTSWVRRPRPASQPLACQQRLTENRTLQPYSSLIERWAHSKPSFKASPHLLPLLLFHSPQFRTRSSAAGSPFPTNSTDMEGTTAWLRTIQAVHVIMESTRDGGEKPWHCCCVLRWRSSAEPPRDAVSIGCDVQALRRTDSTTYTTRGTEAQGAAVPGAPARPRICTSARDSPKISMRTPGMCVAHVSMQTRDTACRHVSHWKRAQRGRGLGPRVRRDEATAAV